MAGRKAFRRADDKLRTVGQEVYCLRSLGSGHMSRDELASASGVTLSTLQKLETDVVVEPGWHTMVKVLDALGTSLDDFERGRDRKDKAKTKLLEARTSSGRGRS